MPVDAFARLALPWLATWLVHSTALLLVVLGITRLARRLAPRSRVALWRVAVFGPLLTATLPFVIELPTAGARIVLAPPADVVADAGAPIPDSQPIATAAPMDADALATAPVPDAAPAAGTVHSASAEQTAAPAERLASGTWIFLGWVAIAALLSLRGAGVSVRVRRRLAARRPATNAGVQAMLARLAARAGLRRAPRVTVSDALPGPIAWGVLRPEICVPQRALDALGPHQQEALLAHELAHIVRRDALWLTLERVVSALFFFQPMLLVARRRLREQTELACDGLAIALTRRPIALAECLTEVAGWLVPSRRPTPAPAMASSPSLLARRVEHLLETTPATRAASPGALVLICALLVGVGLLAPGFTDTAAGAAPASDGAAMAEPADASASSAARLLEAVDLELALLEADLVELAGLGEQLDDFPQVQEAVRRLVDRRSTLHERRDALRRAALGDDR